MPSVFWVVFVAAKFVAFHIYRSHIAAPMDHAVDADEMPVNFAIGINQISFKQTSQGGSTAIPLAERQSPPPASKGLQPHRDVLPPRLDWEKQVAKGQMSQEQLAALVRAHREEQVANGQLSQEQCNALARKQGLARQPHQNDPQPTERAPKTPSRRRRHGGQSGIFKKLNKEQTKALIAKKQTKHQKRHKGVIVEV